jgi:hypothetical protein
MERTLPEFRDRGDFVMAEIKTTDGPISGNSAQKKAMRHDTASWGFPEDCLLGF